MGRVEALSSSLLGSQCRLLGHTIGICEQERPGGCAIRVLAISWITMASYWRPTWVRLGEVRELGSQGRVLGVGVAPWWRDRTRGLVLGSGRQVPDALGHDCLIFRRQAVDGHVACPSLATWEGHRHLALGSLARASLLPCRGDPGGGIDLRSLDCRPSTDLTLLDASWCACGRDPKAQTTQQR
jgi:hypothetical protein